MMPEDRENTGPGAPDRNRRGGRAGAGSRQRGGRLSDSARVEAFSDGVLAIVITLLVLSLRVPQGPHMLAELVSQWPAYLAYIASFGYVGVIWVNHHQLFTRIEAVDTGLMWRNLALLLVTSILPFPTAVVGNAFRYGGHASETVALILYGLVAAVMSFSWLLIFHYLFNNERLLARHTVPSFFATERKRALLGVIAYLVAALVAVWLPIGSLFIICGIPVFYGMTIEGWKGPWKG